MNKLLSLLQNKTEEELWAEEERNMELAEREIEIEKEMLEKLPEELQDIFCEYMNITTQMCTSLAECEYARGFENGLLLMADTIRDSQRYSG